MSPLTEPTRLILKRDSVAATDTNIREVSLLLHGNGVNGSTTITDSSLSPKTVTAVGNAQISTAQSKFGGSSIAFDGNEDYLSVSAGTAFNYGTGDLTIEAWIYMLSASQNMNLVSQRVTSGAGITFRVTTGRFLQFFWDNAGSGLTTGSTALALNTWHHVALTRSGSTFRLFVNGILDATSASIASDVGNNANLIIGSRADDLTNEEFNGYIDELRITKGVARYTSNFTPPTAPFPDF